MEDQKNNGIPVQLIRQELDRTNDLEVLGNIRPENQNKVLSRLFAKLPGTFVSVEENGSKILLMDDENVTLSAIPELEEFEAEPENVIVPPLGEFNSFSRNHEET